MARCERGYLCDVCGEEVAEMFDSDLYLSYIVGLVESKSLLARPERHIRCNPVQRNSSSTPIFPWSPWTAHSISALDPQYVAGQEDLLTRGWRRLQEVASLGIAISEYPLPEIRARADASLTKK